MKEAKEQNIELLAEEAGNIIVVNKYLQKKLDLYKKYLILTKDTMTKCLSDKNNSALFLFNSYIEEIQKDYDNLKEEYDKKSLPKYQTIFDECLSDITMGKPVLKQYRAEDFVLDYLKTKKKDLINGLKKSIKLSKEYHLFREPKRDSLIDIKKGNKEIEKVNTELQQNMLYECKQCNKFSNRIKKNNQNLQVIKQNINILKKYISEQKVDKISTSNNTNNIIENNLNTTKEENEEKDEKEKQNKKKETKFLFGKLDLKHSINIGFLNSSFGNKDDKESNNKPISDENRGPNSDDKIKKKGSSFKNKKSLKKVKRVIKIKNKVITEFKKFEDLFGVSSEEDEKEKIIDDELHSDDETVFDKKIKQKTKLTTSYLDEVKQVIPEINLKQIEFNKLKIVNEADLYSLQKRKYKSQNIDNNIKELKKRIEKLDEKIIIFRQKEKIMKEYVEKIKQEYNTLKRYTRRETSVYKNPTNYIRKSLIGGGEDFIEEDLNDEMEDGDIGSDYENEEKENPDKEIGNNFDNKKYLKRSVFVGGFKNKKNKKMLKQSMQDGIFKNRLRDELYNIEKAQSK